VPEIGGRRAGFPLPGSCLPTIDAGPVRLRAIEREDAVDLHRLFGDPGVTRQMSLPRLRSLAEAEAMVADIERLFRAHALYQWAVVEADDRLVGTATLASLDAAQRRAEIGFALVPGRRGRGVMTLATEALLDFAFGTMRLRRIEADVDPDNESSIRLLERLGFRREGLLRERWLVEGEPRDAVLMGLLAADWAHRADEDPTR
jgi:ribosomal-protein-alanine N-acetyltransferase